MKKIIQPDRPLPMKEVPADALFLREGSRFWQARFRDAKGKLYRRSTGQLSASTARKWMTMAKAEANRVSELPPELCPAISTNTSSPELF